MDAVVGEDGVGPGHVERGGIVGTEGDGGGAACGGDSGGAAQGGDRIEAYLLTEGDGGVVERVCESVDGGDVAMELVLVVARGVGLASVVEGEGGGLVVELGECGEDAAVAEGGSLEGGVLRSSVDEGLED